MAANPVTNYSALPNFDMSISPMLRKGCVGDWKKYFTPEQEDFIDKLIQERLEGTGLSFKYEI